MLGIKGKLPSDVSNVTSSAAATSRIAGVTSQGKYGNNYRSVYELMSHTQDIEPEDMRQYSKVALPERCALIACVWLNSMYNLHMQ